MSALPELPPRRAAELGDTTAIASLLASCMRDPWSEESVRTALGLSGAAALVAASGPRVVGAILMQVAAGEVEVLQLAVDGTWRRRGLGRALLAEGLAAAGRRGATTAYLEVRESNAAARDLYARAGFAEIGRRRGYYLDGEDALVLARTLAMPLPRGPV